MRIKQVAIKSSVYVAGLLAAGLCTFAVIGCGSQSGSDATSPNPPMTPPTSPANAPADKGMGNRMTPATVTAAKLGTAQVAGPFQVTLSTDKAPAVGKSMFHAIVTKNGQAIKNATVTLNLSMPSMNMAGPVVDLKPSGDKYSGSGELMASDYTAVVTVKADGATGAATYSFTVR